MSHPPQIGGKFVHELDHKREFRMELLGFADFRRLTGCDNTRLRLMEAAHVLRPARTQGGWRIFTMADVETAKQWLAENSSKRERA
jgi:hypothetical protein